MVLSFSYLSQKHFQKKNINMVLSPLQEEPSYFIFQSPPPPYQPSKPDAFDFATKVNPSVLLILIILAIIFFLSGLLHILVRFLLTPQNAAQHETDSTTALQGQLQQLFHLHDEGVDQSFIDTLPVFTYKEIIGVKDPFDCAVCLCEFEPEDKLRLLPKCSHAFHMDCIDTWLLSHSTCPICRACLVNDFEHDTHDCSPVVLVLESGETSREIGLETTRVNSNLSTRFDEVEMFDANQGQKTGEKMEKVVAVKLGKFKNVDGVVEGINESDVDSRRCFSMGSFAYVMDDNTSLQVPIRTPMKQKSSKKPSLPLKPGRKLAMSECGGDSRRDFSGFDEFKVFNNLNGNKCIGSSKRGSFSGSKNWLRGRNEPSRGFVESSRRAFSFRALVDESRDKDSGIGSGRTISENDVSRWGDEGSDYGFDIGRTQSFNSLDCDAKSPSFARRTLSWLMGSKPNKVVHSNDSSNV